MYYRNNNNNNNKRRKEREIFAYLRSSRATVLRELSSAGEHDERNLSITENGEFSSFLENTTSSLWVSHLPVGWVFYPLYLNLSTTHFSSLSSPEYLLPSFLPSFRWGWRRRKMKKDERGGYWGRWHYFREGSTKSRSFQKWKTFPNPWKCDCNTNVPCLGEFNN